MYPRAALLVTALWVVPAAATSQDTLPVQDKLLVQVGQQIRVRARSLRLGGQWRSVRSALVGTVEVVDRQGLVLRVEDGPRRLVGQLVTIARSDVMTLEVVRTDTLPSEPSGVAVQPRGPVGAIFGGIAGAALGGALVALPGWYIGGLANCHYCALGGAFVVGMIGESAGLAAGAHFGNARAGDFGFDLLVSAGLAAAALVSLPVGSGVLSLPIILAQVPLTISAERRRGNPARSSPWVRVVMAPMRDGIRLGLSIAF
jgi:hypothetical protein